MESFFSDNRAKAAVIPILAFAVFCGFGLVQFRLWSQVVYIWNSEFTLLDCLVDYHGLRYFLVFPIFQISEWAGVSFDRLFSVTVPMLIFLTAFFTTESIRYLAKQRLSDRKALVFTGTSLFFILLSLFMNGRLMFAIAGSSILLWSMLTWNSNPDKNNFLAVLAAVFLSSVSSGTFLMVIVSFYFFWAVNLIKEDSSIYRRRMLLIYSILLVLLMPYLAMLVLKIFEYFGGGIDAVFQMLNHGYGATLLQMNLAMMLVLIVILALLAYFYRHVLLRYWILVSLIIFSMAGGVFGISTVSIVLPPLLVAMSLGILLFLDKLVKKMHS